MNHNKYILGGMKAFTIKDKVIWGSLLGTNALVNVSLDDWSLEFVKEFPNEKSDGCYLHGCAASYKDTIIFMPLFSDKISIFNISTKEFKQINIDVTLSGTRNYNENGKFRSYVQTEDYLYIIGLSYPSILKLSLHNFELEYVQQPYIDIDEQVKKVNSKDEYQASLIYFQTVVEDGNYMYLVCPLIEAILKYSLEDDTYEFINLNIPAKGNLTALLKHNDIYFIEDSDEKVMYEVLPNGNCKIRQDFNGIGIRDIVMTKSAAYVFSSAAKKEGSVLVYDFQKDNMKHLSSIRNAIYGVHLDNNKIYGMHRMDNTIIEINTDMCSAIEHNLIIRDETIRRKISDINGIVLTEGQIYFTDDFINMVTQI